MISYRLTETEQDLRQILALQQDNLSANLTQTHIEEQGFLTVAHSYELLLQMHTASPSVIAQAPNGELAGYALVMPKEFRGTIPILDPMFDVMDTLEYDGKPLDSYRYFVMGQVCVSENSRGRGLFDGLYGFMKRALANQYDLIITEIAQRNGRSVRAHVRVGFRHLHTYTAPNGEVWDIVVWDWRKANS